MAEARLIASDRTGWAAWIVAALAVLVGLAVTVVMSGAAGGLGPVVLVLLWAVVLLFVAHALRTPTHSATLEPDGRVRFVWQYPLRREVKHFRAEELAPPRITRTRDSDGDRHAGVRLHLPDGSVFVIAQPPVLTHQPASAEARQLGDCKDRAARFCEAVGLPVPSTP